jgi:hypothetical protein
VRVGGGNRKMRVGKFLGRKRRKREAVKNEEK